MNKKIIIAVVGVLVILGIVFALTSKDTNDKIGKEPDNQVEEPQDITKESGVTDVDEEEPEVEVEEEKSYEPVGLKISSFIESTNPETFNEEEYLKEHEGFISAKISDSGELVVEIEEWKQLELVESMKAGTDSVIEGLVNNEDYPFIKSAKVVDTEYRAIVITVDKAGYEEDDTGIVKFVATTVGAYQTYAGLGYDVSIAIIDAETDEELLLHKYPKVLEEALIERQKEEEAHHKIYMAELKEKYGDLSDEELLKKAEEDIDRLREEKEAIEQENNNN